MEITKREKSSKLAWVGKIETKMLSSAWGPLSCFPSLILPSSLLLGSVSALFVNATGFLSGTTVAGSISFLFGVVHKVSAPPPSHSPCLLTFLRFYLVYGFGLGIWGK